MSDKDLDKFYDDTEAEICKALNKIATQYPEFSEQYLYRASTEAIDTWFDYLYGF